MKAPTKEQLNDPKWWDENAPDWATHYVISHCVTPGGWYELKGAGGYKMFYNSEEYEFQIDNYRKESLEVYGRPAKPEPQEWDGEPDAYMCPAGCGCLWRDNGDDTMSLYGPKSQSCDECEPMPLDQLVPVKRLRSKAEREREELSALVREAYLQGASDHAGGLAQIVDALLKDGWHKGNS